MASNEQPEPAALYELLVDLPPNRPVMLLQNSVDRSTNYHKLALPELALWCPHQTCDRLMRFEPLAASRDGLATSGESHHSLIFRCKHCEVQTKHYAVYCVTEKHGGPWRAVKLGELPPFGNPIPSRFIKLLGPDQGVFLKGKRSEEQGFGIGAFAYYRRIVERQWVRLLQEIIRVANRTHSDPLLIAQLEEAAKERQFTKSRELAKPAIPPTLLIGGHNPVALLHDALSDGLHAKDDAHCLELAASIREVLYALSERMAEALREETKLNEALDKLQNRKATAATAPSPESTPKT